MRTKIKKELGDKVNVQEVYEQVKQVIKKENKHLLSVFSIDSGDQVHDIDIAILTALLKGNFF